MKTKMIYHNPSFKSLTEKKQLKRALWWCQNNRHLKDSLKHMKRIVLVAQRNVHQKH